MCCALNNNNKIEIDAGMATLRQPLGHERRPARSNGCRKSGKERKDMGTLPARRLKRPWPGQG